MRQTTTKRERGERLRSAREERALALTRARRKRTLAAIIGGVALTGILILGFVLIVSHFRNDAVPIGVKIASEGSASHVPDGSPLTYKHYPPSSGHHYPSPAPAGISATAIPEGRWVHSLEHGYIVILYKPTAGGAPTDAQLRDIMATF